MKTLLLTLEFPPFRGGVANYYGHLAGYWPLGESLIVLNNNKRELINRGHGFLTWWPAIWAVKRKIKTSKIDYILVGQVLPLGTVAWLLSLFRPVKYAVFLHGMDFAFALKTPRKKWLTGLILKRADKIICANSYVAKKTGEFYPAGSEKIAVVNPGIIPGAPAINPSDLAEIRTKYSLKGKIVLLTLGRLALRKGVDQTIKALKKIPKPLIDNLIYFIAGAGRNEEYLRRLAPPKFKKKIIFLGELAEDEKWTWLSLGDIFIMPAREIAGDFEGFGIVYLEANLCGKPVIAGDSGGIRDAIIDGYNGILVDPEDEISVKQGIIKLASDAELRKKLGRQGRERAIKEFNWEKQISKLMKIIKS